MQQALRTRRRRRFQQRPPSVWPKVVALAGVVLLAMTTALIAGAAFTGWSMYQGYVEDLPSDPRTAFAKTVQGPARIYDRNGTLLYEFEDENDGLRNPVPLRDISEWVIKATIATEDATFYSNPGVNIRGLARAAVENFTDVDAGILQGSGGSGITQQLIKNVFIPEDERYERSIERKLKEAALSLEITERYDKNQILEWYLNQIHYGNRTNGIEAAARRYFGVSAKDLSLGQAALLAGIPQAPPRYDPYRRPEAAFARQHEVLDLMVRHGYISEEEAAAAKAEPPALSMAGSTVSLKAPHWVVYIRDLLITQFGEEQFRSGGLRVTTTLDLALNERAEQIVKDKIAYYESPAGGNCMCHNGSLVAIDNRTGEILAMVGSRDYWRVDIEGENNNAIAIKQPGSALKPFVYLAAFMKGWNPGTIIYDQPTKFLSDPIKKEYFTPVGPLRTWTGGQSIRTSLGNSFNTAAVKAAGFVGVREFIDLAHKVGIKSMDDVENYGVSIATGGSNLTLLDLSYAYSVLANNGEMRGAPALGPRYGVEPNPNYRKLDPVAILKVTDSNSKVLYEYNREQPGREQVVPAGYAYQVTDILKDNSAKTLTYGPTADAQFSMPDKRPVASKTGTQQGPNDVNTVLSTWNFGYTPDLTVGVWVGNQDNKLVNSNLTSASSSLLIWNEFMAEALKTLEIPPKEFPIPPDVRFETVNGKREPVIVGQRLTCAEDLRLWQADGNPTRPTNGGLSAPLDCGRFGGAGSDGCVDVKERDNSGQERTVRRCATPTATATTPARTTAPQVVPTPRTSTGGQTQPQQQQQQQQQQAPIQRTAPTQAPSLPGATAPTPPPALPQPAQQQQQPPVQQPPAQQQPPVIAPALPAATAAPQQGTPRLRFNPTTLQWEEVTDP